MRFSILLATAMAGCLCVALASSAEEPRKSFPGIGDPDEPQNVLPAIKERRAQHESLFPIGKPFYFSTNLEKS